MIKFRELQGMDWEWVNIIGVDWDNVISVAPKYKDWIDDFSFHMHEDGIAIKKDIFVFYVRKYRTSGIEGVSHMVEAYITNESHNSYWFHSLGGPHRIFLPFNAIHGINFQIFTTKNLTIRNPETTIMKVFKSLDLDVFAGHQIPKDSRFLVNLYA